MMSKQDQIIVPGCDIFRCIRQFLCVINDMSVQPHSRSDCVGKILIVFDQKEFHRHLLDDKIHL